MNKPLLYTTRTEFDGTLTVVKGQLPADLTGVFYVIYPVGSVNSAGLPFPKNNPDGSPNHEYGTPIMNGDGMVLQVDFNQKPAPTIKTRLMKTPCYYADYHSSNAFPDNNLFKFTNMGITRLSMMLGARNELNTALVPVQFSDTQSASLLANYDIGRPFVTDAQSLNLVTPVGWLKDWVYAEPSAINWPFGISQGTAHPQFDPRTREVFTVNYNASKGAFVAIKNAIFYLSNPHFTFKQKMKEVWQLITGTQQRPNIIKRIGGFLKRVGDLFRGDKWQEEKDEEPHATNVRLLRWKGDQTLETWVVMKKDGTYLEIAECMHQMGITQDYIILTDCSFKFSLDMMVLNPFANHPAFDRFFRWVFSKPMTPFTRTYIVKRADLKPGGGTVTAVELDKPIPLETIHYSLNYANPNGQCTLYGVHNAATCIAEWLRPYDINALTGKQIDPEVVSLFATGAMDLSRFGKWVFDAENGKLLEDKTHIYCAKGEVDGPVLGPNTWEITFYAYRGMISESETVDEIRHLYFISAGTDSRMLSKFIRDLYAKYPNRFLSVKEIERCTAKSLPYCLVHLNCQTMQPEADFYQVAPEHYLRNVQFVPRPTPTPDMDPQMDGYLIATVQVGTMQANQTFTYESQVWIFDAAHLAQGPLCQLTHPEMAFCFTLHTTWLPKAEPCNIPKWVNVAEDYNTIIDQAIARDLIKPYFEQYVYPNFK